MSPASEATRATALHLSVVAAQGTGLDGQWAADHWDAARLGIPARRGRGRARFDTITQDWLKEPAKRWSRFRLATGCAFMTISAGALALSRFSRFLAERHPSVADGTDITRPMLEDYMAWLLGQGYSASTRALSLSMLRVFFDACHRHGWLLGLAPNATIYVEELPFHHDEIARFIPEFVMAQLESDAALAQIPHPSTRHLVVLLIETGLRGGDACNLAFSSVVEDSRGWPCLRFMATKVRTEQLVPLSAKAAGVVEAQQAYVRQRWPGGSPWLFPGLADNADGSKSYSHSNFTRQLAHWQEVIDLRDRSGQAVRVTGHQFRHTLGTRLINSGVPQHVVQKLLGHASPNMTGHYAKVHDSTVREAFDRYQSQRVNVAGERVGYDPDSPTASAEWVKQNLNRVRDSLPNGYCARPAQQECPHPNTCGTQSSSFAPGEDTEVSNTARPQSPPAGGDDGLAVAHDEGRSADLVETTFVGVLGTSVVDQVAKLVPPCPLDALVPQRPAAQRSGGVEQRGRPQHLDHGSEARRDDGGSCRVGWGQPGQGGTGHGDLGLVRHDGGHRPVQGK